ncbi:hypothetical protein Cob_v001505 [Colletotrichum orbiculare MAFF 240422]|uniref:Uncharacterized protein n=1 Tax=Colletotrichum orbiculare (strain 104-T / ATCC 96160 / CBS 514.97 / LARS 414 / MAFF 240422) TaxID=1213857 RepID=A0A484G6B7_COLOR|nr:hypothetical protein Cob_v001505 [Colletotrichum orbiculare MAFF 240422]
MYVPQIDVLPPIKSHERTLCLVLPRAFPTTLSDWTAVPATEQSSPLVGRDTLLPCVLLRAVRSFFTTPSGSLPTWLLFSDDW